MFGLLDGLFDFNHDGKPNAFERGTELAAVANMMDSCDENQRTELQESGLNPEELEFMDADERRETLEDAGLDPDEYDF